MNIVPNLKRVSFREKKKLLLSALFSIILEYVCTIFENITIAFLQCQFTDSFSFTWAVFVTGC